MADEDIAVPLIYSSGPQTFDYLFCVDSEEQSLEFLRSAYRNPKGQFSHTQHTVITEDDQVVGCGRLYDNAGAMSQLLSSLKQIVAFYGLLKSTEVIHRGLQVEQVIESPQPGIAYISNLGVHPQGKGLGSRLLQHFIERAQSEDFEKVALDVADSNPQARALYQRIGFVDQHHNAANDRREWGHLEGHTYMEKQL